MSTAETGSGTGGSEPLRERVRTRYAGAADAARAGQVPLCADATGATSTCGEGFGATQYGDHERAGLPELASAASLGCGNPLAVAELAEGETVLDLGSGGGLDVLLSARRVGPTGRAYGLDMTTEMLDLARANAAETGAENVEFLRGSIEAIPLPDASVDVVISNCVINLSTDKPAVFAETFRVLRPGGRIGVSDVVTDEPDDSADPAVRAGQAATVGCIVGALSFTDYRHGLSSAGFTDIAVTATDEVAEATHSAIIRATKPA